MDRGWMFRTPYFGERQEEDGRWEFFYKWMPPSGGYYCDGIKIAEVDRERCRVAAQMKVREMCADVMKRVGGETKDRHGT